MKSPKKSVIQIDKLSLEQLVFEKFGEKLTSSSISPKLFHFKVRLHKISELTYFDECILDIAANPKEEYPFSLHVVYHVHSRTVDPSAATDLLSFAKFGAPFNSLTHARELIANLTFRAFGKAARLPLYDIREFGESLEIEEAEDSVSPNEFGGGESGNE